jgi:alkanesulfonate monooxygenase SsuD/methylene tetrahydromethanopterin reductase-like flavin-dependent oxidoreductase (luciferase family)
MDFGVFGLSAKAAVGPRGLVELVRQVERLGYTSWWVGEHVVLPTNTPSPPMSPLDPILDPLVLAKQAASLDVLSGGRLHLGVASGYLEPEMTAVGVPMADRGRRTDEYIDAMNALWNQDAPSYRGKYVSFGDVDAHPRPVGGPRVHVGGHSPAAFRRAVARGHGWIGNGTGPRDLERHLEGLARAAGEVERPARLGKLEITFMPVDPVEITRGDAKEYRDMGVGRLLTYPLPLEDLDDIGRHLERQAEVFQGL